MQPQTVDKRAMMETFLKNPKMLESLRAAQKSKPGSTERQVAKNLMRLLEKSAIRKGVVDGTGGPGMTSPQMPIGKPSQAQKKPSGSYYIFYDAPKGMPAQQQIMQQPVQDDGANDGTGGPGFQTPAPLGALGASMTGQDPLKQQAPGSKFPGVAAASQTTKPTSGVSSMYQSLFGPSQPTGVPMVTKSAAPAAPTGNPQNAVVAQQNAAAPKRPVPATSPGVSGVGATAAPVGSPSLGAMAQQAVNNNTGPTLFATKILQDKEALKKLLPGVPEDKLPLGVSLADQVERLSQSLSEKYQLDTQLDAIGQKRAQGVTIKSDLTGYAEARDTYVRNLNTMIDDYKTRLTTTDLSFPDARTKADKYLNFLYLMKGRQEKRYADFIGDSVAQYQAELSNMESTYNAALKGYTNELNTKSAIKTEDYNRMVTGLTEMYNNIEQAPAKAAQMRLMNLQLAQARMGALGAATSVADPNYEKTTSQILKPEFNLFQKLEVEDKDNPSIKTTQYRLRPDLTAAEVLDFAQKSGSNPRTVVDAIVNNSANGVLASQSAEETLKNFNTSAGILKGLNDAGVQGLQGSLDSIRVAAAKNFAKTGAPNFPVSDVNSVIDTLVGKSSGSGYKWTFNLSGNESLPTQQKFLSAVGAQPGTPKYNLAVTKYNELDQFLKADKGAAYKTTGKNATQTWKEAQTPEQMYYSMLSN